METIVKKINTEKMEYEIIKEAAEILKSGGLVAFPTETVYGLGADAQNPTASFERKAFIPNPIKKNPVTHHIPNPINVPVIFITLPYLDKSSILCFLN